MKALEASCAAGFVSADNVVVIDADILSEGVSQSNGVLLLDEDRKIYIAKTSGDLKSTLDKIASALGDIASALSAIDGKATGTLPPAPVASALVASITATQAQVEVLKETLK